MIPLSLKPHMAKHQRDSYPAKDQNMIMRWVFIHFCHRRSRRRDQKIRSRRGYIRKFQKRWEIKGNKQLLLFKWIITQTMAIPIHLYTVFWHINHENNIRVYNIKIISKVYRGEHLLKDKKDSTSSYNQQRTIVSERHMTNMDAQSFSRKNEDTEYQKVSCKTTKQQTEVWITLSNSGIWEDTLNQLEWDQIKDWINLIWKMKAK